MSGFSARRARTQSASSASLNGFLPPIGKAAGLPVLAARLTHRAAEE